MLAARKPPALLQVVHRAAPAISNDPDALEVVASDETVDSYGDIIRVSGWDLARFKSNPIVLFGHDPRTPVGTATMKKDGKKLTATIDLADDGTSPFIDTLRSLVAQKIVKAVSVGFLPTKDPKPIMNKDDEITGYEFNGQELYELSIVSIPANPASLTLAKGLDQYQLSRMFALPSGVTDWAAAMRARAAQFK